LPGLVADRMLASTALSKYEPIQALPDCSK